MREIRSLRAYSDASNEVELFRILLTLGSSGPQQTHNLELHGAGNVASHLQQILDHRKDGVNCELRCSIIRPRPQR
jgi:hypothetical protein